MERRSEMTVVYFPQPKSVRDPDRAVSSLLLAQVKHLREAEKSLPPRYHSGIFSHAIQTEGEAAEYVRAVTEAIHRAHDEAPAERVRRRARKPKGVIVGAVADEAVERKGRSRSRPKKNGGTSGRKK
jgi:hypothetical protein